MDRRERKSLVLSTARETERFGALVGSNLKGGEVIELVSDLGGGKTTLVRGIARGSGSADHVTSPSFTLRNDYIGKDISILWVNALPRSCTSAAYLTVLTSAPTSSAIMPAMCAISVECFSTFCP